MSTLLENLFYESEIFFSSCIDTETGHERSKGVWVILTTPKLALRIVTLGLIIAAFFYGCMDDIEPR
jgi:hypothetical protein